MRIGDTFYHARLGECQLTRFNGDRTYTVTTTKVFNGENVFRLHLPASIEQYSFTLESKYQERN